MATVTITVTVSPQPTDLITNIVVANGKSYEKDTLAVAQLVYIDRSYTFTSAPPPYEGQEFIRAANNDKAATEPDFLSFTLTADATVYVAFDIRATTLPGWLDASWTETGEIIGTSDVSRRVYQKGFAAGTVTLGGNAVPPMAGAGSMYNVIAIGSGPPNQLPSATPDSATTAEDTAVDLNVLANDVDPDGDPLTVATVTQGGHGAVAINADSTVRYTPNAHFNGADSFTYTIDDGKLGTATVSVTVNPVNDTPVAMDDSASTTEGTPVTISVLANDSDVEGDPLAVESVMQGLNGSVVLNADNTVTYTPNAGFTGSDSFDYTINDGNLSTSTAADTYVEAKSPDTNFGGATSLKINSPGAPSQERIAYMRFDVTGTGTMQQALLKLRVTNSGNGGQVCISPDTMWSEGAMTHNMRPAVDCSTVVNFGSVSSGSDITLDVTSLVTSSGLITVVMQMPDAVGTDGSAYSSKEGSVIPSLEVTFQ